MQQASGFQVDSVRSMAVLARMALRGIRRRCTFVQKFDFSEKSNFFRAAGQG